MNKFGDLLTYRKIYKIIVRGSNSSSTCFFAMKNPKYHLLPMTKLASILSTSLPYEHTLHPFYSLKTPLPFYTDPQSVDPATLKVDSIISNFRNSFSKLQSRPRTFSIDARMETQKMNPRKARYLSCLH